MKTHFSPHLQQEDAEKAVCGTLLGDNSDLSGNWAQVDCKACINRKTKIMNAHEAEERAIVDQMGDMAAFMKRNQQQEP